MDKHEYRMKLWCEIYEGAIFDGHEDSLAGRGANTAVERFDKMFPGDPPLSETYISRIKSVVDHHIAEKDRFLGEIGAFGWVGTKE